MICYTSTTGPNKENDQIILQRIQLRLRFALNETVCDLVLAI